MEANDIRGYHPMVPCVCCAIRGGLRMVKEELGGQLQQALREAGLTEGELGRDCLASSALKVIDRLLWRLDTERAKPFLHYRTFCRR